MRAHSGVLGLCLVLAACGSKFTTGAEAGAGGTTAGGASSGGGNAAAAGGEAAGSDNGGAPSAGRAGSSSGGAAAAGGALTGVGGSVVSMGGAAHGNAGSSGSSGSSGNGGSGGAVEPSPIPELGLALWLRADRGVMVADGVVESWQDQSGGKTAATQTAANVRPKYLATGFNGKPTLEFDGQEDFLKLPDGFADFSHGLAGFVVAKPSDANCASMLEFSNGTEIDDISLGMYQNQWTYEVSDPFIQAGMVDTSSFALYAANHRAIGTADLRLNGNLLGSQQMPVPRTVVRQNDFVGRTLYAGCNYFEGQISEVIVYARAVTDTELVNIESYLRDHWSLPPAAATP